MCDAPLQHLGAEIVAVAQICEAHDVVLRFAVLDQGYARDDLNPQPLRQEGTLFGVHFAKLGLDVFGGQNFEVHVNDSAAGRRIPVEVAHDVGRFFTYLEELLFVRQLAVLAVTLLEGFE